MLQLRDLSFGSNETVNLVDFRERVKKLLGSQYPDPPKIKLSSILSELHLDVKIKRYTAVVFKPYCGITCSISPNVLNTFSPFPYEHYTPTKIIRVRDTIIWKFLFEVYNFSDTEEKQLNYIFDFLAWKLKIPSRRSERIYCLVSEKQGTGKSSFFRILSLIFSKMYCTFHHCLDSYVCRFNDSNHSQLFHHVDDLHGASKTDTRKLFPMVTTSQMRYESKGEKVIQLNEYSELFITANSDSPLYVSPQDRRQVVMKVSPCWKNKRTHFEDLYKELDCLDTGYAFYQFLKYRDIKDFHPSKNPPIDFTDLSKIACMNSVHQFALQFFTDVDWYLKYKDPSVPFPCWLKNFSFKLSPVHTLDTVGKITIRVQDKTLYKQYSRFVKQFNSTSVRQFTTFVKQLDEVGITKHPKRQRLNGTTRSVFEFGYIQFLTAFSLLYPAATIDPWECQNNPTDFLATIDNFLYPFQ